MAMSPNVRFFVLSFFNVASCILCGWFGIQDISRLKSRSNENVDDGEMQVIKKNRYVGASVCIAFALLSFVNLGVFIVTERLRMKKQHQRVVFVSYLFIAILLILGSILIVQLGIVSVAVVDGKEIDLTLLSAVIAVTILSVLLHCSTVDVLCQCRLKDVDKTDEDEESCLSSPGSQETSAMVKAGSQTQHKERKIQEVSSALCPKNKCEEKSIVSKASPAVPSIQVTTTELNLARQRLRKSSPDSCSTDFGGYNIPKTVPFSVEEIINESCSNLGIINFESEYTNMTSGSYSSLEAKSVTPSSNFNGHKTYTVDDLCIRISDGDRDLHDDVFLPANGFNKTFPVRACKSESSPRQTRGPTVNAISESSPNCSSELPTMDGNIFTEASRL